MVAHKHFLHSQDIWAEDEPRGTSAFCFGKIGISSAYYLVCFVACV